MPKNIVACPPSDNLVEPLARLLQIGGHELFAGAGPRGSPTTVKEHAGLLERTKVSSAMTKDLMTVTPRATVEQATKLMLSHKISGLPVTDAGNLVGIITSSDILQAFLEMLGASEEGSFRIDFVLDEKHDLVLASQTIAERGGEVLGVGTHKDKWEENRVCYLHLRATDPGRFADALEAKGYTVLGVYG